MLQSRLTVLMRRELEAQNLQLSPYCSQQIELLVSRGLERMRNNNALDNAAHVLKAEQNLRSLIKYFSKYAQEAGSFPKLSNSEFDAALMKAPTYWPYCISG